MYKNANLTALKARIDAAFPGRVKVGADGKNYENFGEGACNQAHANVGSPHCRGDAVDIHHDPGKSGASGDAIAAIAIKDPTVKKVIFNGMTWERSTGKWRVFKGTDPHRHHVHIEADSTKPKPAARTVTPGAKKKTKKKVPAVVPPAKKIGKKADASGADGGGKLLIAGDQGVLMSEAQLTAAHVETPHTGGGKVKQGSPGVFIGERQLAFARIGDPTTDGFNVKTGDTAILIG
jgi:hypothetical protein